jgi:dTDP-4-amino-4,6-dideoxygalactose transaminase
MVLAFEQSVAKYLGVKHAVACSNGTTALHLALVALGITAGDEVLVPAFSWVSTANAVLFCGAVPVFVDIKSDSFNIDPQDLKKKISHKSKAIIVVHSFGHCVDFSEIKEVAGMLPILEDAACAIGSAYKGKLAGSLGRVATFSFHPRKVITTGEGGMVTTDSDEIAEHCRSLRNHGATMPAGRSGKAYELAEYEELGFNYRMTDLQGALGVVQMTRLPAILLHRRRWADFYKQALAGVPGLLIQEAGAVDKFVPNWQSFVVRIDRAFGRTREQVLDVLESKGISTRIATTSIVHLGYYQKVRRIDPRKFPGAVSAHEQAFSLPLHGAMDAEDFQYVASHLRAAMGAKPVGCSIAED